MTQPYAARFLEDNYIAVCGSHTSKLKIYDKRDFSVSGYFDADHSMFCMDIPKRSVVHRPILHGHEI